MLFAYSDATRVISGHHGDQSAKSSKVKQKARLRDPEAADVESVDHEHAKAGVWP